ncbi:MAG: lysine biosynthesis protein LysW [Anaerolineae bacterium]|nr:lysine biosynthesis protein LysW [Anaerolineae bacterium]
MSESRVVKAICPDCGEEITLHGNVRLGQEVVCPHCDAELEVVEIDPLELDWAYDDGDYEDEEEEDEDW